MDPLAQAQTIHDQVQERLARILFEGGARVSESGFEFRRMLQDADRVQKVHPVAGSLLKARLFAASGDAPGVEYWLGNAESNGGVDEALPMRYGCYLTLGRVREGHDLMMPAFRKRGGMPVHEFIWNGCAFGWFWDVETIIAECKAQNLVHKGVQAVHLAPRAARTLEQHGLDRDFMIAVMTEMFSVLDEEHALWHGHMPIISFHDEGTPASWVMIRFEVPFDADRVADMSWRLAQRLVAKDLDHHGVIVSFSPVGATEAPETALAEA